MSKSIYSVEITIAATVYVVAASEAEAVEQVKAFHMDGGELRTGDEFIDGLPVSGASFDHPDFPDISMSPAITVYAEATRADLEDELPDDDDSEEEDDDDSEDVNHG
jgi:hypothetical protein